MCGRYASYRQAQELADAFDVEEVSEAAAAVVASYNVAPTDAVRVVLERPATETGDAPRRELHAARWGLVPAWADDVRIGSRLINARWETADSRRAFRTSLVKRRCVVPADGYYEWERRDGHKVPVYIHDDDGAPLAFAGLYAWWRDPAKAEDDPARWLLSATILTTDAVDELGRIHDRTPVVLGPDRLAAWLDPARQDPVAAKSLLAEPPPRLAFHEVSTRVNAVRNDGPDLIAPV